MQQTSPWHIKFTSPFGIIWKTTQVWKLLFRYRKYTTWTSCALAQQCYWKFPCTGTHGMLRDLKLTCSHALVHLMLRQQWYGVTFFEFMCSGKHIGCYGTWDSCAVANFTLWYVKFMCAGTQTWCCLTWSSYALAQQLDATVFEVHVRWQTYLMLR